MGHKFDIKVVIKAILENIQELAILLILCTNMKSLYNCFVKLSTTQEEQLMIDMISLHQSYKQ